VSPVRHLARATLVAAALLVAVAAPQPAAAKKTIPCWTKLLNDWYDGRIDNTYPVACYRRALKHLPDDVEVYSSARSDIQRALANAVRRAKARHEPINKVIVPAAPHGKGPNGGSGTGTTKAGRDKGDGPFGSALGAISDSADAIPLPLLILGGLALVLIGAGVAGVVVRRIQLRRLGP
jgi:hypothetical protein